MKNKHSKGTSQGYRKRQAKKLSKGPRTTKLIDRILYDPATQKQKYNKMKRKELRERHQDAKINIDDSKKFTIKLGSFNLNGLDLETCYALDELVKTRQFDVSVHVQF